MDQEKEKDEYVFQRCPFNEDYCRKERCPIWIEELNQCSFLTIACQLHSFVFNYVEG